MTRFAANPFPVVAVATLASAIAVADRPADAPAEIEASVAAWAQQRLAVGATRKPADPTPVGAASKVASTLPGGLTSTGGRYGVTPPPTITPSASDPRQAAPFSGAAATGSTGGESSMTVSTSGRYANNESTTRHAASSADPADDRIAAPSAGFANGNPLRTASRPPGTPAASPEARRAFAGEPSPTVMSTQRSSASPAAFAARPEDEPADEPRVIVAPPDDHPVRLRLDHLPTESESPQRNTQTDAAPPQTSYRDTTPRPFAIADDAEPVTAFEGSGSQRSRVDRAAFGAPNDRGALTPASAEAPIEGVGRPGPTALEGPQQASLTLEKRGPQEASLGVPCRFEVRVRNTGNGRADRVVLTDQTPAGARLISSTPPAEREDGRLRWLLGSIEAGETRSVEFLVEPLREGPLGSVATVTMDASASAKTVCTRPELRVRVEAPDRVDVGGAQIVRVEVSNPGTGVARGVLLVEDVPPELRHEAGPQLEYEVGDLPPGESRRVELRMTAASAGRVENRVTAIADGELRAEGVATFDVVAPALDVSVQGPRRRYLERRATYAVRVDNPGTAAARDVQLVTHLPRGLEFVSANNLGEYDPETHSVYWSLAELPEGQRGEVELVAVPIAAGEHTLRVAGEAAGGLSAEQTHAVRVEGVAALAFEVRDLADPIGVGEDAAYEIRVLNEGTKPAANVRVRVEAPAGMTVLEAAGQTPHRLATDRVEFTPLAALAPGEKAAYRVRLRGVEPGDQRVTVLVESDDLSRPIRREESTRVFGDE